MGRNVGHGHSRNRHLKPAPRKNPNKPITNQALIFLFLSFLSHRDASPGRKFHSTHGKFVLSSSLEGRTSSRARCRRGGSSDRPLDAPPSAPRTLSLSLSLSLSVSLRSSHDSCGVGTLRGRSEHGNVQVFFPYTREEAGCGVNTTTAAEAEAEATSSSLLCAAGRRFARNDARPQSERKEW